MSRSSYLPILRRPVSVAPESGCVKLGDTVVVFAQGPIRLRELPVLDSWGPRSSSESMGTRPDWRWRSEWERMWFWTTGRRTSWPRSNASLEAESCRDRSAGYQGTFENSLRCLRPGGTLSSLGVYSGKLQVPYDAFAAGLGDHRIVTTLVPAESTAWADS